MKAARARADRRRASRDLDRVLGVDHRPDPAASLVQPPRLWLTTTPSAPDCTLVKAYTGASGARAMVSKLLSDTGVEAEWHRARRGYLIHTADAQDVQAAAEWRGWTVKHRVEGVA